MTSGALTANCVAITGSADLCDGSDATGGGGGGTGWASTTDAFSIYYTGRDYIGIGTTTPRWLLNLSTTTAPQLALGAGAGINQWTFRNAGGNLYFATTTVAGTATTSTSALTIIGSSGNVGISTTSPWAGFSIDSNALGSGVPEFVIGSSTATHLLIDGAGRVGIATTSPLNATLTLQGAANLDILRIASSTSGNILVVSKWGAITQNISSTTAVNIQDGSGNSVLTVDTTQTTGSGIDITASSGQTANLLNLYASNGATNYLAVGPSGNFGIASGTPSHLFTIASSTTAREPIFDVYFNSSGATSTIGFFVSTTTGSAAGVGLGLPSALANYIIVGNGKVQAGMAIVNGGLCVDNDGWCTASSTGRISSVETTTGGTDLAEIYNSEETLEAGDVVAITTPVNFIKLADPITDKIKTLGVIATDPGIIMGLKPGEEAGKNQYPVALAGRVPVKITNENGNIEAGDYLTLSSTTVGVAVKATESGNVIGKALEPYSESGVGKISMFVSNTYYGGEINLLTVNNINNINNIFNASSTPNQSASSTELDSTGQAASTTPFGLFADSGLGQTILKFFEEMGIKIMNGIAYVKNMFAEKLTVGTPEKPSGITLYDEANGSPYCVKIVNGAMVSAIGECGATEEPTPTPTPTPTPEIIPNPEPVPTSTSTPPVVETPPVPASEPTLPTNEVVGTPTENVGTETSPNEPEPAPAPEPAPEP